ncbi:MAG TPA: DUF4386 domain-containing protein [Microlunatus sp.]|nr:DUF4386 domain-containing protein [Microlunatus sp.]
MNRYRGNAIAVGLLLIACTATSILSAVPLGSMLDGPDYLNQLAASDSRVIWTALLEFAWAATAAGVAIGLYPVIRRHNRALALGSVAGRVAEGVFVLIGTLSLLALLTVSQESQATGADAAAFQPAGDVLLAMRHWAMAFLGTLPFLTGALMYYFVLYQARLVPRWLSGWGLAGATLGLVASIYSGYAQDFGFTTVNVVLNIPIAVQEMVLAVWLLAKGFNLPSVDGKRASSGQAVPVAR